MPATATTEYHVYSAGKKIITYRDIGKEDAIKSLKNYPATDDPHVVEDFRNGNSRSLTRITPPMARPAEPTSPLPAQVP